MSDHNTSLVVKVFSPHDIDDDLVLAIDDCEEPEKCTRQHRGIYEYVWGKPRKHF